MADEALKAAQRAVREAQQYEEGEMPDGAERHWRRAERLYEDAGVDATWFDDGALVEALDETPPPMHGFWLVPTTMVEATYDTRTREITGIVADVRDLEPVEP